ncbi:Uma2 family endonuclease [Foetidibacter luteolus]|uniref:Uma2 family endonuclease n=1 Tax=Foetidibacter luteolus TaxID=2608880 RepID=UPI00129ADB32|nr:Uma2 family endonuclease [Foetidibacter luteolus]
MPLITRDIELSEEEYIRLEQESDIRHEFVNGKLIDMPGESLLHNHITSNILIALKMLLREKGFSVFMEGIKIKVPVEPKYYYPDVFVTRELFSANRFIAFQPELIAEVLSESTRKYDTVDKFINYQKFTSLQYYLLVEPSVTLVQLFYREGDDWEMRSYTNITDIVKLDALGIELTLKEIYEG